MGNQDSQKHEIDEEDGTRVHGTESDVTRRGQLAVAVTQIAAYALLIGLVGGLGALTQAGVIASGVLAALAVAVMIVAWPFANGVTQTVFARALAVIVFAAAVVFVVPGGIPDSTATFTRWSWFMIVAFLVIIVASFGHQMWRKDRSHLIVSMSTGLIVSACALGAACWLFLPSLMHGLLSAPDGSWIALALLVVVIALGVLLLIASGSWWNEIDGPSAYSWLGMGVMPVMLLGYAVYVAALVAHLTL